MLWRLDDIIDKDKRLLPTICRRY